MYLVDANLGWLWSIFASFWFWLDKSLFSLIGGLYDILMSISRTTILSQTTIQDVASRIQLLLGVFMLFKVGFSLITYIVNPDDFSDKSKGIGKLVMNSVISLALLVIVPYIFNMAYRVQALILEENVLARMIFGNENNGYQYDILTGGEKVQFEIMLPFFQPDSGIEGMESCASVIDTSNKSCDNNTGVCIRETKFNDECAKALRKNVDEGGLTSVENYIAGVEQSSFGLTFRLGTITTKRNDDSGDYLFNYKWPLTTIAGVIVSLLLISFCIDVAIRSVKLAFLQLIAPIPIISFMDPKSSKDGLFTKWYKMCLTTYLSLFVRLLALFLGIFIITNIDEIVDVVSGATVTDPMVKVFIIIGVLFFVKQLPKILQDLGVKLDGDGKFNLNPFKKMEEGMLGGKFARKAAKGVALGTAGAAVGLGVGAVGMATHAGKGKALSGMFSGLKDGLSGKKLGEIHKNQVAANSRMREALANGSTFMGRRREQLAGTIGSAGPIGNIDRAIGNLQDQKEQLENSIYDDQQTVKHNKDMMDNLDSYKSAARKLIEGNKAGELSKEYRRRLAMVDAAKNKLSALDKKDFIDKDGNFNQSAYDSKNQQLAQEVRAKQDAVDKYLNGDAIAEMFENRASMGKIGIKADDAASVNNILNELNAKYQYYDQGVDINDKNVTFDQLKGLSANLENQNSNINQRVYDVEQNIANIDRQISETEKQKKIYESNKNALGGK